MPIVTFAEFVVEQAIGIAIGAAAVVAAPKAGPKLAELSGGMTAKAKSLLDPAHRAAGKVTPTAAAVDLSPASLFAGASTADVVSWAPGRMRLRFRQLRRQPQLAEQTAAALVAADGIHQVRANPSTGSVLILYDAGRYPSLNSVLEAIASS